MSVTGRLVFMVAASLPLALTGIGGARALPASPGNGTWHTAIEAPGLGALNKGGDAIINSISCPSAGNCGAAGGYTDGSGHAQAFVASEVNGTWHNAIEVPGSATLNAGKSASSFVISCGSVGNCGAGGFYTDSAKHQQAFVVSEVNGVWHNAIEVPGLASLNTTGVSTAVDAVSCRSTGNCSAGGVYNHGSNLDQAFVVSEVNGVWHSAIEVPGIATLSHGTTARVIALSCGSPGNCSVTGDYQGTHLTAFVANEVNGSWRTAIEMPGLYLLNKGNAAGTSVSCPSAGNCAAGGYYTNSAGYQQVYVASEVKGSWRNAVEVPGTATLSKENANGYVSCYSAGNCTDAGNYADSSRTGQIYVAQEVNGVWRNAVQMPGTSGLHHGEGPPLLESLSCPAAGNCSAGGAYEASLQWQAFVTGEVNGTWRTAIEVPGTATLNKGGFAGDVTLSCAAAGSCGISGYYTDGTGHQQAWVASES